MKIITRMIVLLCAVIVPAQVSAAAPYKFEKIASGLTAPAAITQPPNDTHRLFVAELAGRVRIVEDGKLLPKPFLDISSVVESASFGQGLFNVTFHPDYATNGYLYITYSDKQSNGVLARYTRSSTNADAADPTSAKILLTILHPHGYHYGGQLVFGRDGYLYVSSGDGGSKVDKDGNAQNPASLLGAILRIDVDHGDPYSIPPDNPFGPTSEVWAKGLRHPWTFSFDSATGDLYLPDVGEGVYEEINYEPAGDRGGENYGWNRYEGTHDILGGSKTGLTFPVMEYAHIDNNCAIIGGYVYHGTLIPDLAGHYVFGDYCSGKVWMLSRKQVTNGKDQWSMSLILQTGMLISAFGQDNQGEIYVADLRSNSLYRLTKP